MNKPLPSEIIKVFPDEDTLFEAVLEFGPGGDEWKFEKALESKFSDKYGPQGWEINTMHRSVRAFIIAVDQVMFDRDLVNLIRDFLRRCLPDYFALVNVFVGSFEYENQTRTVAIRADEIWISLPYKDGEDYLNDLLKVGDFRPLG